MAGKEMLAPYFAVLSYVVWLTESDNGRIPSPKQYRIV